MLEQKDEDKSDIAGSSRPHTLIGRAIALHQTGKFADAEQLYRKILEEQPRHFDCWHLLGLIRYQLGEYAESARHIDIALSVNPSVAAAHNSRGAALKGLKRLEEAVASYDRAIAIKPDYADAFNNRGVVLVELERLEQALASYDQAIALKPDFFEAFNNRGLALAELKRFDEALVSYDQALAAKSDYAEALCNRAATLNELGRFEDALAHCERAIAAKQDLPEAFYNRGNAQYALKHLAAAAISYDDAIGLNPDYAEAFFNRGTARMDLKRVEEALADFDRAIALRPDYADAFWNRANGRLLVGRYPEGWRDYEWRMRAERAGPRGPTWKLPQWDGRTDLAGKTLLLHAEQGFGDTIMMARYVRSVAKRGARIIFEVPHELAPLLTAFEDVAQVVVSGQTLPAVDLQCPLMSLPGALGTTVETIPREVPYLAVPRAYAEKWQARLREFPHPRIGISWAGRPSFKRDHDRSIGLAGMLPLLGRTDVSFISMQKWFRAGDADILRDNPHIVQVGDGIDDFADTAAIMASLDLVISSDTSTVHLAGAMAKPVWILLHFVPDWRWLLERNDSPWYPTARLFRQPQPGDWTSVVADVAGALQSFLAAAGHAGHR